MLYSTTDAKKSYIVHLILGEVYVEAIRWFLVKWSYYNSGFDNFNSIFSVLNLFYCNHIFKISYCTNFLNTIFYEKILIGIWKLKRKENNRKMIGCQQFLDKFFNSNKQKIIKHLGENHTNE